MALRSAVVAGQGWEKLSEKKQLILPYKALRYLPLFKGRRYSYGTTNTVFWQLSLVTIAVNFLKAFVFFKGV